MTSPEVVLSVKNLRKTIGKKEIIKGISFDVLAGEVFGFLGPNGSGKTTTIRMLVDLIRPSAGTVQCAGFDVHVQHDEAMRHIGCIVENPEMYGYMTGWQNLQHFANMVPDITASRIEEVTEIVGLTARIDDKVKTYSLGMRQRLGIAQALLGRPKLLILDEPTNGLDPQGIKELRLFIRNLAQEGMSIFVSSHLLSEIQLLCDRVAILSRGTILAVDRVDQLLVRPFDEIVWTVQPLALALRILDQQNLTDRTVLEDNTSVVVRMKKEKVPELTQSFVFAGVQVSSIEQKQPVLEQLFLALTEGETID
jgi:ABC-2 type transport system ATP-binding protein